ncbi:MAG: hypothetical protein AAF657_05740 [Acidobacteriota bacterium]
MIAPLRRRHRWMTMLLAVVLPVLYIVALAGRQAEPIMAAVPSVLAVGTVAGGEATAEGLAIEGLPVTARVVLSGSSWTLELTPSEPLARPEVLVYWSDTAGPAERLPDGAYLLGAFGGVRAQAYAVSEAVMGRPGSLVLYSLGHQEVLGSVALPAIGTAPAPAVEPDEAALASAEETPVEGGSE